MLEALVVAVFGALAFYLGNLRGRNKGWSEGRIFGTMETGYMIQEYCDTDTNDAVRQGSTQYIANGGFDSFVKRLEEYGEESTNKRA